MPSTKRAGDDIEGGAKKKGGNSSRTGQACDRCKIRKIRCDARPGGCSPCIQNNTECKTTDRITGRATARGHTEQLENENTSLKMYMVELQQQLREHGLEPKAPSNVSQDYMAGASLWEDDEQRQGSWGLLNGTLSADDNPSDTLGSLESARGPGLISNPPRNERRGSQGALLPDFRPGCIGDNYLGVSSANNWLSPIEGTSLALFGMKIDVAEFLPPESDPLAAPMSYRTFLAHSLGKTQPARPPELPPYEEFKQYADWFFKTVSIFVPVVHRPDFMKLLSSVFNGQHQPTPAETVMLHMVVAIMKFQYYCRNKIDQLCNEAMSHYLYALTLIPDLITGHTLSDIQALVLICSQLRNQPRPGAAWMFTTYVFGIVIEIGLHRSANNWQGSASERDPHTVEMRKRLFWSILLLLVSISGKLGRPMPIRLEDFDIEIPEAHPDNMPGETNLSKWRKCSFRAAIQGFRALKILIQAYSTVYSIRSGPQPYDMSVQNIDKQLSNYLEQLPPELSGGPQTVEEDRTPALYLQFYTQGARLLLRHPSLCRSTSPHLLANNLDVCLDASNKLLSVAVQLKEIKGLDTTWMQTTDFLAAMFTTLFVHTQRQDEISSAEFQQLRQDMDAWLGVMEELGQLLGAGSRLRDAVKHVADASLGNISRHLAAKTASAGLASTSISESPTEQSPEQEEYTPTNGLSNHYGNGNAGAHLANASQQSFPVEDRGVDQHNPYSTGTQIYSEPQAHSIPTYGSGSMNSFDHTVYDGGDIKPNVQTQMNTNHAVVAPQTPQQNNHHAGQIMAQPAHPSFLMSYQPQQHQNGFHPAAHSLTMPHAGSMAWRNFADNMMTNIGAHDYVGSANALMALGGDKPHPVDLSAASAGNLGAFHMSDGPHTWPLVQYHNPAPPPNGQ